MRRLESLLRSAETGVLEQFDAETEHLLLETFGTASENLEAYKYATVGDAETMINLPESAQEPAAQDLAKIKRPGRRCRIGRFEDEHVKQQSRENCKRRPEEREGEAAMHADT